MKGRKRGVEEMGQSVLFPLGLVLASSDLSFQRALAIFLQHLTLPGSVCYGAFEGSGASG